MSRFFEVLAPPRNPFYVDDAEVDLSGKTAYINKSSVTAWKPTDDTNLTGRYCMAEFEDKLHIITQTEHVTFDGEEIVTESMLPEGYVSGGGRLVVWKGELHLLGGGWTNLTPADKASALSHYVYNSTSGWRKYITKDNKEVKLPYQFYNGSAVVFKNEICIFGGGASSNRKKFYHFDGSSWKQYKKSTLPEAIWGNNLIKLCTTTFRNETAISYLRFMYYKKDKKGIYTTYSKRGRLISANEWSWDDDYIGSYDGIPTGFVVDDLGDDEFRFISTVNPLTINQKFDIYYVNGDYSYTIIKSFSNLPLNVVNNGYAIMYKGILYLFKAIVDDTGHILRTSIQELYTLDIVEE